MIEVIPGILEQNFAEIEKKIRQVEEFCPWIQIDLLDGTLFANSCFHNAQAFTTLRTVSRLELHMMVINPQKLVDEWAQAGIKRFIGHIEGITDCEGFIAKVRSKKLEVGLAVDIETDVSIIQPYLPNIDMALIMSIKTGKSGQAFDDRVITKIQKVKSLAPDLPIEIDGGINLDTGRRVVQAGATRLVSTSFIFNSPYILQTIKRLQEV